MGDVAVIFGTGLVIYLLYVDWGGERLPLYLSMMALSTFFTLTAFYFAGMYDFEPAAPPPRQTMKILVLCTFAFLTMAALIFALKVSGEISRVWAFSWFFSAILLIGLERRAIHVLVRKWPGAGQFARNIAVVGAGEQGERLVELLARTKDPWIRVLGVFDDRSARAPLEVSGILVMGDTDDLVRHARRNRIDEILIALPWSAEKRLLSIVDKLKALPVPIRLSPDMVGLNFPFHGYVHVGGVPSLRVSEKPLAGWNHMLKAIEDRVLAAIILLLILPFMLFIAVAVKLESPGPALFRQRRYGFNNKFIEVWKFRTMFHDQNPDLSVPQATRDDPRVTRLGRFLRRSSLDELPQFVNVLRGDMSIVGPRPHAVAHNEQYAKIIDEYLGRHRVKPGITGWAQVNGWRGETETVEKMKARVEHDIFYFENWSLAFDFRIIAKTVVVVVVDFFDKSTY